MKLVRKAGENGIRYLMVVLVFLVFYPLLADCLLPITGPLRLILPPRPHRLLDYGLLLVTAMTPLAVIIVLGKPKNDRQQPVMVKDNVVQFRRRKTDGEPENAVINNRLNNSNSTTDRRN